MSRAVSGSWQCEQASDAGFTVLAFEYRHLGESGGQPRQVVPIGEQLADWRAAIAFALALPEVHPDCVAIWGYSASGGYVFPVAAGSPELAAAISDPYATTSMPTRASGSCSPGFSTSSTASRAAMATASSAGSGSRVVSF